MKTLWRGFLPQKNFGDFYIYISNCHLCRLGSLSFLATHPPPDNNETGIKWLTQITYSLAYKPTKCQVVTSQFVTRTVSKLQGLK